MVRKPSSGERSGRGTEIENGGRPVTFLLKLHKEAMKVPVWFHVID